MSYLRYVPQDLRKAESIWLTRFARDVYSQTGEDGIIEKLFEVIGPTNRYCVEFGAWDGVKHSNCRNLLVHAGWSGLLIEGNSERYAQLRESYAALPGVITCHAFVGLTDNTLDNLLDGAGAPRIPDLMSIDVDGIDWHILGGLRTYRPRVVVIEFNPCIPNDVAFVQDPDPAVNQGASLLALIGLAKTLGYELIATTACNAFFVINDEFAKLSIADNGIYAMHTCADYEMKLFQLYDGTLKLAGYTQLHWMKRPIGEDELQVLPASGRRFES